MARRDFGRSPTWIPTVGNPSIDEERWFLKEFSLATHTGKLTGSGDKLCPCLVGGGAELLIDRARIEAGVAVLNQIDDASSTR